MNVSAVVADISGTHAQFAVVDQDGCLDRIQIYQCALTPQFLQRYVVRP
jgi:hypothetical protein